MDKRQKELIQSYYSNRNNQINQSDVYRENELIDYAFKKNLILPKGISIYTFVPYIARYPEMYNSEEMKIVLNMVKDRLRSNNAGFIMQQIEDVIINSSPEEFLEKHENLLSLYFHGVRTMYDADKMVNLLGSRILDIQDVFNTYFFLYMNKNTDYSDQSALLDPKSKIQREGNTILDLIKRFPEQIEIIGRTVWSSMNQRNLSYDQEMLKYIMKRMPEFKEHFKNG